MSSTAGKVEIRPMALEALKDMFAIDKEIRAVGKTIITYANVATEDIFAIDREANYQKRPVSYITGLLDFGFVAEIDGCIGGFILSKIEHIGENATEVGTILILGVRPRYQRRGIASKLVTALCEKYNSKGIKIIRATIDQRDKDMISFAEHMGFLAGHRVDYYKPCEASYPPELDTQ